MSHTLDLCSSPSDSIVSPSSLFFHHHIWHLETFTEFYKCGNNVACRFSHLWPKCLSSLLYHFYGNFLSMFFLAIHNFPRTHPLHMSLVHFLLGNLIIYNMKQLLWEGVHPPHPLISLPWGNRNRQLIAGNGPTRSQREITNTVNGSQRLPSLGQSNLGSHISFRLPLGEGGLRTKGVGYIIRVWRHLNGTGWHMVSGTSSTQEALA